MNLLARANLLAFAVPASLMAGALGSQYFGHLYPCEMCWWQRWPHYAAILCAGLAYFVRAAQLRRMIIAIAAGGVLTSGAIGVFHAGVEYHWWQGITGCSSTMASHSLSDILSAPLIRCDQPQWTLFGISLAGFNALISVPSALFVFALLIKDKR
jgi:disulfide bond formation protein DsbB